MLNWWSGDGFLIAPLVQFINRDRKGGAAQKQEALSVSLNGEEKMGNVIAVLLQQMASQAAAAINYT